MAQLAGYGVHPHDKPELALINGTTNKQADRPALIAQAAQQIQIVPNFETDTSTLNSIHNYADYHYFTEEQRKERLELDVGTYRTRKTPIGCFYTREDILAMALNEAKVAGSDSGHLQNINSSVIAGVLFTGNGAYKVYHTDNTAPKTRISGDEAMTSYLKAWAGTVYKRSIENLPARFQSQQLRGAILMGDGNYRAAISVLENTWSREIRKNQNREAKQTQESRRENFNLKDIPETFYLPMIREALPIYSAMIYPEFELLLRSIYTSYMYLSGMGAFTPLEIPGLYEGKMADGRDIACMIPLKLDRIMNILRTITVETKGVVIFCPEYERKFYDNLFQIIDEETAKLCEVIPIPQDFIEGFIIGEFQKIYGYDGPFVTDEGNRWTKRAREIGLTFE